MVSLFFWRKKKKRDPLVEQIAPAVLAAAAALAEKPVAQLPTRRLVYALALNDPRAADLDATPDDTQTQLLAAATQEVTQIGTEPRYTPPRPSLLPQLMEAVTDEDASLRALARIVAQDAQLTGEMLRAANSPLYRVSANPVESIERAAALLGTRGIRTLISSALMKPLAGTGGRTGRFGEIIWEYSQYSASAAEAWAARNQDSDPFAAHMVTLLHGLGVVTVYRVLADLYAMQPELPRDAVAMACALDTSATVAASGIAGNWGLSDRTRQALEAQSSDTPVDELAPLARALQFGLHAGALTLLCKRGRLTEEEAGDQVTSGGFQGPVARRVWERLLRAYVRP